ncbi:MAG: HIT domain-containing protein [Actinomycetota bacterium]|nr:HIT domain-containing protein [Actinomycetota bacterium]
MERLWRPWRINYIRNIENVRDEGCIFCTKPKSGDDEKALILYRGETVYMMMNLFPYNTGHVMVSPYRHLGQLEDLDDRERAELMELSNLAVRAIKEEMQPQAFNLGMNIGKVAGAGFHEHLHMHVVPRWLGDTNFMPVVAKAKVMPESLEGNYKRLLDRIGCILEDEGS